MNDFALLLSLTHTQNIDNILTPTVQCNDKKSKLFSDGLQHSICFSCFSMKRLGLIILTSYLYLKNNGYNKFKDICLQIIKHIALFYASLCNF